MVYFVEPRTESCLDESRTVKLILVKNSQGIVLDGSGNETQAIDAMARLANDESSEFDWFNAAHLAYQMGRNLEAELAESL